MNLSHIIGLKMTIPFGKYKGQQIDVLENDFGYMEWIVSQDWMQGKYPELYEAIVELQADAHLDKAQNSLSSKENILLSIDLKHEKIENFDEYPLSLPVVKNLERTMLHPHVTYIVGENGSGKSTLLEALAISQEFNPEGGTVNFNFSTRASHSELHKYLRVARTSKRPQTGFFLRAESFFNVATAIEGLGVGNAYGERPLHELSHGEAFISLMKNRFGANGLYILDEPEAALSPQRQLSMIALIHDLIKQGSQFIISTHSPILLAYPSSTIYEIQKEGLVEVEYEDTDTYRVSIDFLSDREKMLDLLLE